MIEAATVKLNTKGMTLGERNALADWLTEQASKVLCETDQDGDFIDDKYIARFYVKER